MKFLKNVLIIATLVLTPMISFAVDGWANPTKVPPNDNTQPPINVGSATQIKSGTIGATRFCIYKAGNTTTPISCLGDSTGNTKFPWVQTGDNITNTNSGDVVIKTGSKICLGGVCIAEWETGTGGGTGTVTINNPGATDENAGTIGRIPKFTGDTSLGDSSISEKVTVTQSDYVYTKITAASILANIPRTVPRCDCDSSIWSTNCGERWVSKTKFKNVSSGGFCEDRFNAGISRYYYLESAPTGDKQVIFDGTVAIKGGSPGNNKILASDNDGNATWKNASDIISIASGAGDVIAGALKNNNYITMWTDATKKEIGNSILRQVGEKICMGGPSSADTVCIGPGTAGANGLPGLMGSDGTVLKCLTSDTNKVLKWNGRGWNCADMPVPTSTVGGITGIKAGNGITVSPTTNQTGKEVTVSLSSRPDPTSPACTEGQVLKFSSGKWTCGTVAAGTEGINITGACSLGQVVTWNGSKWLCTDKNSGGVTINNTNNTGTPLSGTPNAFAKFTGANSIGDAGMTDNGARIQSYRVFKAGAGLIIENRDSDSGVPSTDIGRIWFNTKI